MGHLYGYTRYVWFALCVELCFLNCPLDDLGRDTYRIYNPAKVLSVH